MNGRPMITTRESMWAFGFGQYWIGLGIAYSIDRSAWWLLLVIAGLALCGWSGSLDAKAEIAATRDGRWLP